MENQSFLKNHADTLAIIGVNLAIAAIILSMWVSNTHRIDAMNTRIDTNNARSDAIMNSLQQTIIDFKNETKDFHARLSIMEERTNR